jgi:arginine deiminase
MDKIFHLEKAREEHDLMKKALEDAIGKENVYELKDVVLESPKTKEVVKAALKETYENVYLQRKGYDANNMEGDLETLVNGLGKEELWQTIALNLVAGEEYKPLSKTGARDYGPIIKSVVPKNNLFFMRDQQITGDKGIILGNMSKSARKGENLITKLAFEALGAHIEYEVTGSGTLEGGDFIPCGDYALIGCGSRTNKEAIKQILENQAVGYERVIVVNTPKAKDVGLDGLDDMDIMHLDTYFNFAGKGNVVAFTEVVKKAKLEEYVKTDNGYVLNTAGPKEGKMLWDFLENKGYNIIGITQAEQKNYAINILTVDENTVIVSDVYKKAPHLDSAKDYLERFTSKGLNVVPIDMRNITDGYGCIHCMTCPLERTPHVGQLEKEQSNSDLLKEHYHHFK